LLLGLVVPDRQAAEQKLPDSWKDSILKTLNLNKNGINND
jgi:hypothetical protein